MVTSTTSVEHEVLSLLSPIQEKKTKKKKKKKETETESGKTKKQKQNKGKRGKKQKVEKQKTYQNKKCSHCQRKKRMIIHEYSLVNGHGK
jgi:hypothetical protein